MIITKASIDLPVLVSMTFCASPWPKRGPARAISKTRRTEMVKDFVEKIVTRDPCWAGCYPSIPAQSEPINNVDIVNAHARVLAKYRTIEQSDVESVGNDDGDVEHSDLELIEVDKEPKRCSLIDEEAEESDGSIDWETAADEEIDVSYSYDELVDVFGSDLEN